MSKPVSVKATPILMQPHLVAATFRGDKWHTRRGKGLKFADPAAMMMLRTGRDSRGRFGAWFRHYLMRDEFFVACPWGGPGDLAWVREKWFEEYSALTGRPYDPPRAIYAATETRHVVKFDDDGFTECNKDGTEKSPWRPSIHMPRWASRLTLLLKEVRVERVNEISNADSRAEGIAQTWGDFMGNPPQWALDSISEKYGEPGSHLYDNRLSRENFRLLYESINGHGSFDNRWNWVLVYEPIAENVDTVLARMEVQP